MAIESSFLKALLGLSPARVEAALKAMPLSGMVGIVPPAATSGKLPELLALLAVGLVMKLVRNDLAAAVAGAATVAVARLVMG